ncbi:MAG: cytochrome b N-terminal domain-containing protein [Planctomycetia bacterium]|nr:cytochrome b N-terminal domain-containing protein [Planctomycetia bacterium]
MSWRGLLDGLDVRLGWREARARAAAELARPQPARAGWGVALGGAALGVLGLEALSGLVLAAHYRASPESAHASVAAIRDTVPLGWLWLSVHAWGTHALVALALLQAAKVFISGAHKRPRELTWVAGALVLFAVLGLAVTGHLLPWTNEAFWSTSVRLGHVESAPLAGPAAARLLRGGDDVGAATLSRFYILHVAVLPALLAALLALHLRLVRRLGLAPGVPADEEAARGHAACSEGGAAWLPQLALRAAAGAAVAVAALLTVAALHPPGPAAAAGGPTPAGLRPEWFFLALFQFLKLAPARVAGLPGESVAQLVPLLAVAAFALLPFLDRSPARRLSARKLSLAVVAACVFAWGALTVLGAVSDRELRLFGKTRAFDTYGRPR